MSLPQDTYTIEALVNSGKNVTIKYSNLSYLEKSESNFLLPIKNVIWDYMDELINASVLVRLSDAEFQKYKFKPKILAFDLYGNTELDFVIMVINNIADCTEFSNRVLRLLKVSDMQTLITLIYNSERLSIESYNSKL